MSEGGFIYAITAVGTKYVKIGSAMRSIERRMKLLQTGIPFQLELAVWIAVKEDLLRVEKALHRTLAPAHFRGEWFELELNTLDLKRLVRQAVAEVQRQGPQQEKKDYCDIHIDVPPEIADWAKRQPEGVSALVRRLLAAEQRRREGRRREDGA